MNPPFEGHHHTEVAKEIGKELPNNHAPISRAKIAQNKLGRNHHGNTNNIGSRNYFILFMPYIKIVQRSGQAAD